MTELRKIVFNTLHNWIAAHHSLLVSIVADFLTFCLFIHIRGSRENPLCTRVAPLCALFMI